MKHSDHSHDEHHDHSHEHSPGSGHSHDHDHVGHSHAPAVTADNARRIRLVFIITTLYAVIQAVGGWLSGSLALIADSGHMVSDSAALLLALIAYQVAARAPDSRRTYGFHRVRVLAALANGATLLLLVVWIVWEAIARFREPVEVMAWPMLIVASIGLLINIAGALILNAGNQGDSNLRGALLHVMGDLLGSVGAIAAAIGIMLTGWTVLDPILSVIVALLVVRSAWRLIMDSIQVLLQATPAGIDVPKAEAQLRELPGVADAGHFHAWTLTDDASVATVHVTPAAGVDSLALPSLVGGFLREQYGLTHVTVQVDPPGSLQQH